MTDAAMRELDELVKRALHGEASETEVARLAQWRRAAPENEQHYRRTQRLIEAAHAWRGAEPMVPPPPRAAAIVARVRA